MNHVSLQWIAAEVQDADPNSKIFPHPFTPAQERRREVSKL
jgi:hypothetical protein